MIPPSRALQQADYGPRARVGIATPQANPTVEPELRELLPACIGMYATRLSHRSAQVEQRLNHYVRHMPEAIESFGTMKIRAFGFGCTASSYLAGRALEAELTEASASRHRIPVITAAQAIRRALETLGMTRIALVSPYPAALAEAGYRYWEECGLEVVARLHVDPYLTDTHRIYELSNDDALAALRRIERHDAQCVLASGTGMPTLRALRSFREETAMPVLSSNLCLAWALVQTVAPELAPATPGGLLDQVPTALAAGAALTAATTAATTAD
jgi:maleate isomerase